MRKNYTHWLDNDLMAELDARIKQNNDNISEWLSWKSITAAPVSRSRVLEYALRAFLDSPDGTALLPPVDA